MPPPLVIRDDRLTRKPGAGGARKPLPAEIAFQAMSRWASTITPGRILDPVILYVVIMKSFNMNQNTLNNDTLKPSESPRIGRELARDESGRLYSVRMRELFDSLEVDMSVVEAMSA